MLFAVYALDDPGAGAKRQAVHAEHVAHLKTAKDQGVTIVVHCWPTTARHRSAA